MDGLVYSGLVLVIDVLQQVADQECAVLQLGLQVNYAKPFAYKYNMYNVPLALSADSATNRNLWEAIDFNINILSESDIRVSVKSTKNEYEFSFTTLPATIKIGEGIFICENTHSLDEAELKLFTELFSTISVVQFVETNQLSIGGTVAGCGPAFASMFIEALADAGVMHGLSRPVAYRLASQMIVGTGKLQLETGNHPGAMKDAVCAKVSAAL